MAQYRIILEYVIVCLGFVWSSTLSHLGGTPIWGMPLSFALVLVGLFHRQCKYPVEPSARPGADRGLWMVCCFPYAIYSGGSQVFHGDNFRLIEITTAHALLLSLTTVSYAPSSARIIASSFVLTLLLTVILTPYSLINSMLASIVCSSVFCYSRDKLKIHAPTSFTDGELITIVQAISVFTTSAVICFFSTIQVSKSASFLQGGLFSLGLLIFVLFRFPLTRSSSFAFFSTVLITCSCLLYPLVYWSVGGVPAQFLVSFLTVSGRRIALLGFWFGMTIAAIAFAAFFARAMTATTKTAIRKVFHIFILVVFTTGACLDPELTYLASGCILGVMIVLEVMRVLRIKPVGPAIQHAFNTFLDAKDQGPLVLSHIYLLLGCSLPFFLYPGVDYDSREGVTLALLTGVTTIGVGDTAAALIGGHFGRIRWPGTRKTLEGTAAAVVAQLAWCIFFAPVTADALFAGKLLVALLLTSCLEATTEQIDNLAVPLFAFPLFLALL
ncbi:dolichol kinase-like [Tropilaelaps mercedesae]|uniref:dolichol kinase n=1 Tax=Tropilaelaps mercedesae TaxID=418985 RepID=A0A1V9XBG6_9ACAR|nr:dolichol kinase-like [Tropilaelaps mercedesae]